MTGSAEALGLPLLATAASSSEAVSGLLCEQANPPSTIFPQARAQGVILSGRSHAEGGATLDSELIARNWQGCGGRGPQALPFRLDPGLQKGSLSWGTSVHPRVTSTPLLSRRDSQWLPQLGPGTSPGLGSGLCLPAGIAVETAWGREGGDRAWGGRQAGNRIQRGH